MRRTVKQQDNFHESKSSIDTAKRLGDTLNLLMEEKIAPQQKKFNAIFDYWSNMLPLELCRHSKITDISDGQLKVMVDSPSYLYELRLCSKKILEEIHYQCPHVCIKKIKLTIG